VQRIEDDSICIEDMLKECGVIDQSIESHPDMATKILSDLFGRSGITIDANLPGKKVCDNSVSVQSSITDCAFTLHA
jgi:U3 small nucleolar RNA-associated protein 5